MVKTNIKLRVTPEQSEDVQHICFANGVFWYAFNPSEVRYTDVEYLFIDSDRVWFRSINDHNIGIETEGYTEVDADLFIRTNGTCVEPTESLTEESQFAKYGFKKPDFECELLKEFNGKVLGIVYSVDGPKKDAIAFWWDAKTGKTGQSNKYYTNMYNLTPIKKPWYETCTFPCIIMEDHCMPVVVNQYKDGHVYDFRGNKYCTKAWRLLTNTEIEGLKQW